MLPNLTLILPTAHFVTSICPLLVNNVARCIGGPQRGAQEGHRGTQRVKGAIGGHTVEFFKVMKMKIC